MNGKHENEEEFVRSAEGAQSQSGNVSDLKLSKKRTTGLAHDESVFLCCSTLGTVRVQMSKLPQPDTRVHTSSLAHEHSPASY